MYDEEIYKLACTYMAKTEEYDRSLSNIRCRYDETQVLLPTAELRKKSYEYSSYLWGILDPHHVLKKDILYEITKHPDYTAQHWINEYYRLIKS